MQVCKLNHPEICFTSKKCPLCALLQVSLEAEQELTGMVEQLMERCEMLEAELNARN
jgi:hypothetical protein